MTKFIRRLESGIAEATLDVEYDSKYGKYVSVWWSDKVAGLSFHPKMLPDVIKALQELQDFRTRWGEKG